MSNTSFAVQVIIFLSILILVFLICREIVCWYWKINEQLSLMREIRDLLKTISQKQMPEPSISGRIPISVQPDDPGTGGKKKCALCYDEVAVEKLTKYQGFMLCDDCLARQGGKGKLYGHTTESRVEESTDELKYKPVDQLTETELRALIFDTNKSGEYLECKKYLETVIDRFPDSRFIDFIAKDRLREVNQKLGLPADQPCDICKKITSTEDMRAYMAVTICPTCFEVKSK